MSIRLTDLAKAGQSIWLDALRRYMLCTGELQDLIAGLGVSGVTSNPAVFEKVVAGSRDYKTAIPGLVQEGKTVNEVYHALAVEDVGRACDLLLPLFEASGGRDGFATLDVAPQLSHDTQGTIDAAVRLAGQIGRRNAMVKIPATTESLPAVQQLVADGVNLHVTRLFDVIRYRRVIEAWLAGLEARHARGQPLDHIRLATSFLIGRIDLLVDGLLDRIVRRRARSRRRPPRSAAGRASPWRGWPTTSTARCCRARASGGSRPPGPSRRGWCGPAPTSSIRSTTR